jgi:hypothetical protein
VAGLARRTASDPFPGRVVEGADLDRFAARAKPVFDAEAAPPPIPPPHLFEVRR